MSLLTRLLSDLADLAEIEDRPYMGGWCLLAGGRMFAVVQGARVWFFTDERNRFDFVRRGMVAYASNPAMELGRFYEVPPEVLGDSDQLRAWARKALAARGTG
ncbi:MAG TPA: TfoX/Sxy family protein [Candidatus Dormibacteraeota bacterium]